MDLKPISYKEFEKIKTKDKYYNGRWGYYNIAITFLRFIHYKTALELGPYRLPILHGSDTIDRDPTYDPTYCHDAHDIPWPVESKYDVFIALQVFEHLLNRPLMFLEVMRVADNAIISVPYKWTDATPTHNNIDMELIKGWTLGVEPVGYLICSPHTKHRRIVLYYTFTDEIRSKAKRMAGIV